LEETFLLQIVVALASNFEINSNQNLSRL